MIIYENLMGGMISSQFPYLLLIFAGWLFSKMDLINKDGNVAFSKLSIEVFLPIYLFIQTLRGTTASIISNNYLLILSELFAILMGFILSLIYIFISKMDVRMRYTFIAIACFNDIKKLHFLMSKSFCYHLKDQNATEKKYCANQTDYPYCHIFFQGILIWYIADYFLRKERKKVKILNKMNALRSEDKAEEEGKEKIEQDPISEKDRLYIKDTYEKQTEGKKVEDAIYTDSFVGKIQPVYMNLESTKKNEKKKSTAKRILYVLFRAPIIALFTGFVVGFIEVIRTWLLRTDTAVYLFYDTFNSLGNSHIICGLLVVGANLYLSEDEELKQNPLNKTFSRIDYAAVLIIKCIIMPFLGVIFGLIAYKIMPDNRPLIHTSYMQWVLPTSLDIMNISQAWNINARSVAICIFVQYVILTCLSNFIILPAFLKAINEIN